MARASALHRHTPTLAVRDARGLALRQVAWYRAGSEQAVRRAVLARHDVTGQVRQQWDPRLFEVLEQDGAVAPNQHALTSLSGRPLLDHSSDAGWQLRLPGDAGQVAESWDTRGSHWRTRFDERLRPLRIEESAAGQPVRVSTGFTYAIEAGLNRRGRLVRQDDEAGSRWVDSYALTGQVRSETRHFLATLDLPDWPDAVLETGDGACTTYVHGPLQQVLGQTDALGNRQSFHFNLSGELKSLVLQLEDDTEHRLLADARYNAFGQIESQTAGNGVVSHCEYEPSTGRLSRRHASRPGRSLLQDLCYDYDPVGNVVRIEDRSQPVRHFANQRVDPVSTFAYDSLYQLIEATGRESLGALIGPQLPELAPNPGDTSNLLNYRQHFDYDASGNLLSLRHIGQQSYTRTMSVAADSNHAVPEPGDPLTAFDPNGNLFDLGSGQPLRWSAHNQLHSTRQVGRDDGPDDEEQYRYGADSLRLRKTVSRVVSGRVRHSETRYLPGLELHRRPGESFSVVTVQAGRCTVRCLCWTEGAPDGIASPQLRYSLDDQHHSSGLELDDEARIISHEGWYPFGGTAWWAGRSGAEAGYKARRYSGKERDASGLYDYGLRYYAPWLMRWINPDPASSVDGLNLFKAMRNNPVTLKDSNGLMPALPEENEKNDVVDDSAVSAVATRDARYSLPFQDIPYKSAANNSFSYIRIELGENYYLYLDTTSPADNLIISAHGGFYPWDRDIRIPANTTMAYYNPHGTRFLSRKIGNLVTERNEVFIFMDAHTFTPRKQEAQDLLDQGKSHKLSGSRKPTFMSNYHLYKNHDETVDNLVNALSMSRFHDVTNKFDILTVRNRKSLRTLFSIPTLKGVLHSLEKRHIHYNNLYGAFCRENIFKTGKLFDPERARNI